MPTPHEDYRTIELTQGQVALVDAADFQWLSQLRWRAHLSQTSSAEFYASSHLRHADGLGRNVYMHRLILGLKRGDGLHGDHINGNTLDNRRSNLRIATPSQNHGNQGTPKNNTSGFKGVYWHEIGKKWMASITFQNKQIYLGLHGDRKSAHAAYCAAGIKLYGEFFRI